MLVKLMDNKNFLQVVECSDIEFKQLQFSFRKKIKNWRFHPQVKRKLWDGYMTFMDSAGRMPVGLWNELIEVCKDHGFAVNFEDFDLFRSPYTKEEFLAWVEATSFFDKNGNKLQPRDYQVNSVWTILKYKYSISEIATSAGKTLIIYMVMAFLKHKSLLKRMLVIVPNISLIIQTYEDFQDYSNEDSNLKLQMISGETSKVLNENTEVVIGTFQSLVKQDAQFFEGFDVVCVDEAHFTQAKSVKETLAKCRNIIYRFGLSGTLEKDDFAERLTLQAYLGPMINKVSAEFLFKNKYATPVQVKVIKLNYMDSEVKEKLYEIRKRRTSIDGAKILDIERKLVIESEKRLNYICDLVNKTKKNTLILFHNVKANYGKRMQERLYELSKEKDIFYIDGETDVEKREYFKQSLEEGHNKVLIASFGTFSTGISVKNIHNIVFSESFKSDKIIRQSIGRGMRLHESKTKTNIIDICDDFSFNGDKNFLIKHMEKRLEIYDGQGFPYKLYSVDL
jgi:superfamily II DNA or RNA helicase